MASSRFLLLTVAGVGDRAGSRKVKLDEGVLTQTDVSGNSIASVGLLYECKGRSIRTTNRHSGSSRVEEPRPPVD